MQLKRDASRGRILDGGNPIILVGGAYYLFKENEPGKYGLGEYGLDIDDGREDGSKSSVPYIWYPRGVEPCQSKATKAHTATLKDWPSVAQLFSIMKETRNNLLRIFLTNSYTASDLFPYKVVNGKLAVQDAVQNGNWNETYFNHLRSFAQQADGNGVALQLSVFNFFDFDRDAWPFSPWNATKTHDITPGWSAQHLVADVEGREIRCRNFMDVSNANLTQVKRAFINKLVDTLRGQGNIIFELMNEPRGPLGTTAKYQATFLSHVAGLLISAFGTWRPLLSANAFPPAPLDSIPLGTPLDVDTWKAERAALPHFDAIDIFSYHGVSGTAAKEATCGNANVLFPLVDPGSIAARTQRHFNAFPDKALIYSTDGAKVYNHEYVGGSMSMRDGQIITSLAEADPALPPVTQRHQSDVGDWGYWCLRQAVANPGRCHFQNHTSYYRSFLYVKDSYAKAGSAGSDLAPPFAAAEWTTWQWRNTPAQDFSAAVHFDASLGSIVVQLGTVASPADASQSGAVEVGFQRTFSATSGSVLVVAYYAPKSVSVRSNGALVAPAVAVRLHAVDASGNVGALVARAPALLQPGAPAGRIEMSVAVAAGQRYALILAANVGVQYQNRAQGYGEIIVSYPRTSLFL
jgi:hypothetical protein